jgi:hypothetical protein
MSSKKIPYIVGWILMLVEVPSKSRKWVLIVLFWAEKNATLSEIAAVNILVFVFIDWYFVDEYI